MANLGDIGKVRNSTIVNHEPGVSSAIISQMSKSRACPINHHAFSWFAPTDPIGRGNSFTVPTLNKVVLTLQGRFTDMAQGGSGAVFYDVASGTYYAYELNGSACWKVEITNSTITVTPQSSGGGGGGGTSASAYVLT